MSATSPVIAVVDYGVGNLRSAAKGLERAASELGRDADVRVTGSAAEIERAAAVVLPGVGAFGACMDHLRDAGLVEVVRSTARSGRPFLGICVGMQILFEGSTEFGPVEGLGVLPGMVTRLRSTGVKIPHMGWNALDVRSGFPYIDGIADGAYVYFVHSYAAEPTDPTQIAATTTYGGAEVVAAVGTGALLGTQFHPEKSQATGLALLKRFVAAATPARVALSA